MVRKGFESFDYALMIAQRYANSCERAFRVWKRTVKAGDRFDICEIDELPRGDGCELLREVQPEPYAAGER